MIYFEVGMLFGNRERLENLPRDYFLLPLTAVKYWILSTVFSLKEQVNYLNHFKIY